MTKSSSAEKGAATDAEERNVFLADSGKPVKPVVTSGEFGSSGMQTIQTDCLWNLLVANWSMSMQKTQKDFSSFLLFSFGY